MEQSLLSVAVGSNVNTRPQPFFNTKPNMHEPGEAYIMGGAPLGTRVLDLRL